MNEWYIGYPQGKRKVENIILPLGVKTYAIARDTELNQLFRKIFSLPEPLKLIKVLSEAEMAQVDDYVRKWYEAWLKTKS